MKKIVLYSLYAAALLTLLYFDKALNLVMSAIGYVTAPIKCSGILLLGIVNAYLNNSFGCLPQFPDMETWKAHLVKYRDQMQASQPQ